MTNAFKHAMNITERPMTAAELAQESDGFAQHAIEHGNSPRDSERFGFVATHDGRFIGASSGLAYPHSDGYADWFQLTDLFVEKPLRGQGLGADLLRRLEHRVRSLGITHIWTWTAGYEGPSFYKKQGYIVFLEKPNFYESGHARVGLQKDLRL